MSTEWESIEEREQRVRGSRTTDVIVRASDQVSQRETLQDAFTHRAFIARSDLDRLATRSFERPVISLYLNFSPERLVRADRPVYLSIFSSLRHQALEAHKAELESLPHAQRLGVPADLTEVQAFLEGFRPEGARALAIFKSGTQLNLVVPLPVRVADHLMIEADPYIEPLEAILEEQHRVLIVDVARGETTVSIYSLGQEFPVASTKEDLPRERHEAFREGKTERHRETHVVWHLKASAQLADQVCRETACDLLVLFGEDVTVKAFVDYLPKALRQRLIATKSLSPEAGPNDRRALLEQALNEQRGREEEATLSDLGMYRNRDRLASGLASVIDAGNLFLMRQLVIKDDLTGSGFICHAHHFLSLQPGKCPFDGTVLVATDVLIDELIEMARLHDAEVMLVSQRKDLLDPYDGVAAILVAAIPAGELRTAEIRS